MMNDTLQRLQQMIHIQSTQCSGHEGELAKTWIKAARGCVVATLVS